MEQLGRYHLIEKLSRASDVAERFRGYEVTGGGLIKPVLVKKQRPELISSAEAASVLVEEGRIGQQLDHPHIVRVLDLDRAPTGGWYLVEERLEGRSLQTLLRRARSLKVAPDPCAALFVCLQLLDALRYAHERTAPDGSLLGIVHRDLHPSNIAIGFGGEVRLGGFGFAKISGRSAHLQPGLSEPRFGYLSPEQALDSDTDHRADLFCVGLLLYELLAGQPAYQFEDNLSAQIGAQRGTVPKLQPLAPGTPPSFVEAAQSALCFDRTQRPASAALYRDKLATLLHSAEPAYDPSRFASYVAQILGDEADADRQKDLMARRQLAAVAGRPAPSEAPKPAPPPVAAPPPIAPPADVAPPAPPETPAPPAEETPSEDTTSTTEYANDFLDEDSVERDAFSMTPNPDEDLDESHGNLGSAAPNANYWDQSPETRARAQLKTAPEPEPPPEPPTEVASLPVEPSPAPAHYEPAPVEPAIEPPAPASQPAPVAPQTPPSQARPSRRGLKIAVAIAAACFVGLAVFAMSSPKNFRLVKTKARHAFVGRKPAGTLKLDSVPPGAKVIFNDDPTGLITPIEIEHVESEVVHHVRLELEGAKPLTSTLTVQADQKNNVTLMFKELMVELNVRSEPIEAKLFIDGKEVALTPAELPVLAGKDLELKVELLGYHPFSQKLTPERGKPISLDIKLEKTKELIELEALQAAAEAKKKRRKRR